MVPRFLVGYGRPILEAPVLYQDLHLLILGLQVVLDLLRELLKSVDEVFDAVSLIDLRELRHVLLRLLTQSGDDTGVSVHVLAAVQRGLVILSHLVEARTEARLSLVSILISAPRRNLDHIVATARHAREISSPDRILFLVPAAEIMLIRIEVRSAAIILKDLWLSIFRLFFVLFVFRGLSRRLI